MLYFNKKGRYQKQYDELSDLLIRRNGVKADTVQGRLVQAIAVLALDYRVNGSAHWEDTAFRKPGVGYHHWGSFVLQHLLDETIFDHETLQQIQRDYELMKMHGEKGRNFNYTEGEDAYDRMTDRVVEFCRARPELEWIDQTQKRSLTSIAHVFE